MAARAYICQSCGAHASGWTGKCAGCGVYNALVEESKYRPPRARFANNVIEMPRQKGQEEDEEDEEDEEELETATTVGEAQEDEVTYVPTGISELDRVLGGGVVPGGIILLTGDPGAGKSTLAIQTASALTRKGMPALYVSGEEREGQVASRARRLGVEPSLQLLSTNNLAAVFNQLEESPPGFLVLDSVQTVRSPELDSPAGSVSQLKEVTQLTIDYCKSRQIACIIIGHVTKDGAAAGPKALEHLVDTTLHFEGEDAHSLRLLKAIKNRFGTANEVGLFEMTPEGMQEVPNPSAFLLAERWSDAPGSCVVVSCEGRRGMLVECQALVTLRGNGRRTSQGVDPNRINIILAVLRELVVGSADVFVNLAGGVRVSESGLDLGIAVAVGSSILGKPVISDTCVFGEIGLNGEIRSVGKLEARVNEAAAMGFRRVLVPMGARVSAPRGVKIVGVRSAREAIALALGVRVEQVRAPVVKAEKTKKGEKRKPS